jgi:thymidylate synthase ThyX
MQAQQEEVDLEWAHSWWKRAAASAAELANEANGRNLHKQVANRILEPFQFMTTLVTSTDWDNFMLQRVSAFADPNLEHLASLMKKVLEQHTPDRTRFHLPYITLDEDGYSMEEKMKISAARCCRVSYNRAGESSTLDADIDRHNSLVASGHWSPFEHVAIALDDAEWRSGNFEGWHQYRNILQGVLPVAVTRKAFNLNLLLG